jgi:hypothetical protein
MKKLILQSLCWGSISAIIMAGSCSKDDPPPADPCTTTNLTVSAAPTPSSSCVNNGSISITASGGSGLQYKLDNGAFGSANSFSNLAAGMYTVTVKNNEGCTKTATATVTTSANFTETIVGSNDCLTAGTGDGSISVTPGSGTGTSFEYKLDAGNFQTSNSFTNVSPGMHTISVKNVTTGCTEVKMVTINLKPVGPQFTALKNLLTAKCGGCHAGGANSGGFNFDNDCNLVARKTRIKVRAVDQGDMPPNGALTAAEKQTITNWINGGGLKSN